MSNVSRRKFVQSSVAAAGVAPLFLKQSLGQGSANDRLNVASIGTSNCHMANIAMKLGRRLQWDPKKEEFLNDEEANAMRTRVQREEFKIEV